jgi:hypothetical protein
MYTRNPRRFHSTRGSPSEAEVLLPLAAGLKYIKLKLVHTRDSVLKRPCVYGVVGTSFLFCRKLSTTEEAHVSN